MELKNKSLFKQECFIGGKWVKSLNNDTIQVDNPATLKSIGNVPKVLIKFLQLANILIPGSSSITFNLL